MKLQLQSTFGEDQGDFTVYYVDGDGDEIDIESIQDIEICFEDSSARKIKPFFYLREKGEFESVLETSRTYTKRDLIAI